MEGVKTLNQLVASKACAVLTTAGCATINIVVTMALSGCKDFDTLTQRHILKGNKMRAYPKDYTASKTHGIQGYSNWVIHAHAPTVCRYIIYIPGLFCPAL